MYLVYELLFSQKSREFNFNRMKTYLPRFPVIFLVDFYAQPVEVIPHNLLQKKAQSANK